MNQYHQAKALHKDCLMFFRLGDFYELFYEDAKIASELLNITLTKRVQKNEEIPMAGVPFHTANYYIAKLIKAGKKIAICDQIESAANKSDKIIQRQVVRIITPGTLSEDVLLEPKRNNFLISLFTSNFNISAGIFDLSTNEFYIQSFEPSNLRDFLEKHEPSEILINQNFVLHFNDYENWKNIITFIPEITPALALSNILNFFKLHSKETLSFMSQDDFIAAAIILDYILLTQKNSAKNISLPTQKNETDFMQIDKFTRRNLELTKTLQNEHKGSLLWLLDQTKTAQGARLLFQTINEPITNIETLKIRQNKIEEFMKNKIILEKVREILKHVPDFERMITKIALNRFTPLHLRNLAIGINNLQGLCQMLKHNICDISHISNKIIDAISHEAQENRYITYGTDAELDEYKTFEQEIDKQIQELEEHYKKETKIATLRIKLINIGYVIEVSASNKDKLSYNFALVQDLKNAARYMSPQLEKINKQFATLEENIVEKEKAILQNLAQELLAIKDIISEDAKISAQLDLFSNFAYVSLQNNYIKPELCEDKTFEIINGRHPILDNIFKSEGKTFCANDCNLSKCVIFMTGPNMAGKSTYLRQQALIAIMAHIGMYIPAESAKIGIIDKMFSRIGANDNIMQGNSTFMMEMIELSITMNQATEKSFIIFDEVGRGTSANEGMALAQAILEYLTQKLQARTLFATHYLQLKNIVHENLAQKMMEIKQDANNPNSISFTHKIIDGVAEKSWALAVAAIAGLPKQIVERANEIMQKIS